jgi:hypothetical protein
MAGEPPTPGAVYAEFEDLIHRVERWVSDLEPTVPGCEDAHVRGRLVQRVVQITDDAYADYVLQRSRQLAPPPGPRWGVDGLTIDRRSGRVNLGARQWLRDIGYFALIWLDVLARLLAGCVMRAPRRSTAATVLMEAGGYSDSDAGLAGFCARGPIEPLAKSSAVIVHCVVPPRNRVPSHLHYSRRPFVHLANQLLRRADLSAPVLYLRAILACRLNVLLGRDLSMLPVVAWLDRRGYLDAVIMTTTAFRSQPLWAKGRIGQRAPLQMIWYSQNCIPKMYTEDSRRPDLPNMRHMRVDVHWVWTKGFGDYLKGLGQTGQIRAVGPILWYLPEDQQTQPAEDFRVAVFDITPLPDGKTAFGATRNYYTVARITRFITDIVRACEEASARHGRPVRIAIKHKRAAKPTYHDSTYLEFLDALVAEKPHVTLADHQVNLYDFMADVDVSVSVPYTSTAYLSAALAKPAVYYDPFADIVPVFEPDPLVHFVSGPEQLRELLDRLASRAGRALPVARAN